MAVNLIEQFGRERTRDILESSFAQFQADRAVVDLARKVRGQEESLAGYAKAMQCHLGDFAEYYGIRRELTDLERKTVRSDTCRSRGERDRRQRQLTALRKRLKQHPCHSCSDREAHARWAERWWRLKKQSDDLRRQVRTRTGAVAKVFDRVTDVLLELDYLTRNDTAPSRSATRAHPAAHLRRTRPARRRVPAPRAVGRPRCRRAWPQWPRARLRAATRRGAGARALPCRRGPFRAALDNTTDLWARLDDLETAHRLPGTQSRWPPASPCRCTAGPRVLNSIRCSATPNSPPATSCA
jgi:ATP-dependent RNA helicase HelY